MGEGIQLYVYKISSVYNSWERTVCRTTSHMSDMSRVSSEERNIENARIELWSHKTHPKIGDINVIFGFAK